MANFGYDISNYTDIDPLFGCLEDFDALLAAAHSSGLKLLLDLVPNHTSDRHPWFEESRSSRENPKRDWYIWRDPGPMAVRRTIGSPNSSALSVAHRRYDLALYRRAVQRQRLPGLADARQQSGGDGDYRGQPAAVSAAHRRNDLALHGHTMHRRLMPGLVAAQQ
jgi:Alpha amylase, catalytic domain